MPDHSSELQKAIYALLSENVSVKVYDKVPRGASVPYIMIGDATTSDASDKTAHGMAHTVTISAYDESGGRIKVKEILGEVYDNLHRSVFSVDGCHVVSSIFEYGSSVGLDADEKTYHGVHRYRIITKE